MTRELWSRRVDALGQFRVIDPAAPVLAKDDEHHLRTVLRAKAGEEVVVTNGAGDWSLCEVTPQGLTLVSDVLHDEEPVSTTLYLAPLKGDRSEWAVAKATELGVRRIVPLLSQRVVVKFKGETKDKVLRRWQRIADEACGQSRRTYDVRIEDPVHVRDVPVNVAVCEFGGTSDWANVHEVAIGPEGGWDPDEWGQGRRTLSLGPTVLRGETAAVAAATLLSFSSGGWAMPAPEGQNG